MFKLYNIVWLAVSGQLPASLIPVCFASSAPCPWMLASPENRKKSNFYLQTGCTRSRACSCNEPKRFIFLFFAS